MNSITTSNSPQGSMEKRFNDNQLQLSIGIPINRIVSRSTLIIQILLGFSMNVTRTMLGIVVSVYCNRGTAVEDNYFNLKR